MAEALEEQTVQELRVKQILVAVAVVAMGTPALHGGSGVVVVRYKI